MTRIYFSYLSKDKHDQLLHNHLPDFSIEFQQRLLRFRRWEDAQLSVLGKLLLKHGFYNFNESFCEKDLSYTSYNKPFLKDHRLKFNVSHSGDIAICAITDTAGIGIDIEVMKETKIEDFRGQMTEGEWTWIDFSTIRQEAFFTYWTQKEAVIKAHGMGLSIPLKSFEINDHHTVINGETFFLKEIGIAEDYKCHLAFKDELDTAVLKPEQVNF